MTAHSSTSRGKARDHHIGMIVPSSNLTMETELPRMLRAREGEDPADRFVFHSARARMQHVTPEQLRAMNEQSTRAATELADARPDVVATACLVAIMAQGPGFHCTAEGDISRSLRAEGSEAPVVSSAGALLSGIEALAARRVAIITPYLKPLTQAVVEYLEDAGITVVDSLSLEVPDNREVARLDPADLLQHHRTLDLSTADALVLSACVQMPSLPSIQPVEDEVGIPVLSAATATTYRLLSELGLKARVPGAGRLLSGDVSPAVA
ncbi:Asp/Glu racemase [Saccharomonospora sp. CUA-673]|uniref:maleate cis-trans isomerase family protein n=1 Tax=Saccharomonospora sp. CUA-673 TaxID=1904969 RepID=UPI0009641586|nr:aspartate/glutamate racemase family protein [Saccharomonospora sp. CUA-673]OLT43177.1 Asp/Glu racemase [Saccharomonospora sp. CUA-673]